MGKESRRGGRKGVLSHAPGAETSETRQTCVLNITPELIERYGWPTTPLPLYRLIY